MIRNALMFLLLAAVCVFVLVGIFGCSKQPLPTQPTEQPTATQPVASTEWHVSYVPLHHNIPATFAEHPEGPMVWLCATQPRAVEGEMVEDHYLQYAPCPATPIP